MTTIRDVIAASPLPRLESRMLLAHALNLAHNDHAWLIAHDRDTLSDAAATRFASLVARRVDGEPIAYLIGGREFYGREFRCTPAALIPRPETELLVDQALLQMPAGAPFRVLDVGTGTGCVAITMALERPGATVTAIDISTTALALAHENAQRLGASVGFIESSWFTDLRPEAQFDLILSNPPYIAPGDAHLSQGDLRFEPAVALADAVDGLESYRQLAQGANKHLRPGGMLIVEHGFDQGETVPALFRTAGFDEVTMHRDLADQPRITLCRKPLPR
jgi:release factor glutamine methyltransferase